MVRPITDSILRWDLRPKLQKSLLTCDCVRANPLELGCFADVYERWIGIQRRPGAVVLFDRAVQQSERFLVLASETHDLGHEVDRLAVAPAHHRCAQLQRLFVHFLSW